VYLGEVNFWRDYLSGGNRVHSRACARVSGIG
jgi:hypothetical protein